MHEPAEPAFLRDASQPYPLGYARDRMLEAVCAFPIARDGEVREALVGYTARGAAAGAPPGGAADGPRRSDDLGLLQQAEVFRRFSAAVLQQPTDVPISVDRAGV